MVNSYNGWSASRNAADFGGLDNRVVPGTAGVKLAPGVRAGDVAEVLFYVASQLDARVEDGDLYTPGDEWGYYYKQSANSKALLSCHSSGTAFDWNATRHPNAKRGTYSAAQVAEIRKILAEVGNVVYWGGDAWGNGTPDEMHFEIREGVTEAQVVAAAARLRGQNVPDVRPVPPTPTTNQSPDPRTNPAAFQRWYNAYNFRPALLPVIKPIANNWGPQSDSALRKVQARYGLGVDGIPGPQTRAVLYTLGYRG